MLFKIRSRQRQNKAEKVFENVKCANCETEFSGNFCPKCGQAIHDYDKPLGFIIYNFLGDFFAFDIRFFKTLVALIWKPGFVTNEYFAGRRVRYAPPIRIFIFVSFVFFLLLQVYTNRGLARVLDSDFENGNMAGDSTLQLIPDSLIAAEAEVLDMETADSALSKSEQTQDKNRKKVMMFGIDLTTLSNAGGTRKSLNKYAENLELELEKETVPEKRSKLREYIRLWRSPESAVAKILKYISYAFFILLPIFALLLKLVYVRRKQNYMRHLVFSIHIHSFIFLVLSLMIALYMMVEANLKSLATVFVFAVPVYIIIALKKVYGQHIGKVISKFFVLSFLYNIVFITVVVLAALDALSLF